MTDDDDCCKTRVAVLESEVAALRREVGIAHNAHADIHGAAQKVTDKDSELLAQRLEEMNRFREEGRKAQETYIRADVHNTRYDALAEKVDLNTGRLDRLAGIWVVLPVTAGLVGLVSLAVSLALALGGVK